MADESRVGYLLISKLDEDSVLISARFSWGLGLNRASISIKSSQDGSKEIVLGRTARVILVRSDGAIDIEYIPITRDDLRHLEQSLEASVGDHGSHQAASVALASDLIASVRR